MFPWLSITNAEFCKVSLFFTLSKIEETITILCFLANYWSIWVDYPSRGYENSTQGYFSRVHTKKGAVQISCNPNTLTFYKAASSIMSLILSMIAFFCSATGLSVGKTILFWTAATLTSLWGLVCYLSQFILNFLTSTSKLLALLIVYCLRASAGVLGPYRIWRTLSKSLLERFCSRTL